MSFPPRFGIPPIQAAQFVTMPYGTIPMVPVVSATHYLVPTIAAPVIAAGPRPMMKRPMMVNDAQDRAPTTTVFVGNIHERATNELLKSLLNRCGGVTQWKRVYGSNNRFQAFGFCEFDHPDATLRALRLLNDFSLGGKKLSIKADEKTREIIKEFINKRRSTQQRPLLETSNLDNIPVEEFMRENIDNFKAALKQIVGDANDPELLLENAVKEPSPVYESNAANTSQLILPETEEAEKQKLEYIEREIKHFRTVNKQNDQKKQQHHSSSSSRRRDRSSRSASPSRQAADVKPPPSATASDDAAAAFTTIPTSMAVTSPMSSRASSLTKRPPSAAAAAVDDNDDGGGGGGRRHPSRKRSRSKESSAVLSRSSPSRSRRRRSRSRSRSAKRRNSDEEEEIKERKRLEKKIREKEHAYQERLKKWESRERKKAKEHDKRKHADKQKRKEDLKEAKKLKEFFEDYDDETEDVKYYKGKSYEMRRREFDRERDLDNRDRQKEKDELDEVRRRLLNEGVEDPEREILRLQKEQEDRLLRRLRADDSESPTPTRKLPPPPQPSDVGATASVSPAAVAVADSERQEIASAAADVDENETDDSEEAEDTVAVSATEAVLLTQTTGVTEGSTPSWRTVADSTDTEAVVGSVATATRTLGFASLKFSAAPLVGSATSFASPAAVGADPDASPPARRRLVPLDYGDVDAANAAAAAAVEPSAVSMTVEEKRKAIKALIEKIPTAKDDLFAFPIDWPLVDAILVEKRLKPWVNKKIVEYIGEEEVSLVDFICQKVAEKSSPQSILEDVSMVLDDEAAVFVIKLWRLLIYEIEAKRFGLVKLD